MVEADPQDLNALLIEMDALNAAVQAVEGRDVAEALDLTRQAFPAYANAKKFDTQVIACAMAYILGEPVSPLVPKLSPQTKHDHYVFEAIGYLWANWIADPESSTAYDVLRQDPPETAPRKAGAIDRMALTYWHDAIRALIQGDIPTSRRCWQRAMEIGSSYGTDSHPVVSWTYAASFFPRPTSAK